MAAINLLEKMDTMITNIVIKAENDKCAKKEQALWTPDLKQSNLQIHYRLSVKNWIKEIKRRMSTESSRLIDHNKKSLTAAKAHEIKKHKLLCKDNVRNRREYLQKTMEDMNNRDNKSETTIKQLMSREQNRSDFKIIKNVMRSKKSKGIKYLDVPDSNNKDRCIRLKDQHLTEEKTLKGMN
jgi:hypothetical protein